MEQKIKEPFLIGLLIILLSFFFSFLTIKVRESATATNMVAIQTSLGSTGIFGKLGIKLLNAPIDSDMESFGDDEQNQVSIFKRYYRMPRAVRIYFVAIFAFTVWGIIVCLAQDRPRDSNKKWIVGGIALSLLSFIATLLFEVNTYTKALDITGPFRLSDYYSLGFGIGFFMFFAGLIISIYGAFNTSFSK